MILSSNARKTMNTQNIDPNHGSSVSQTKAILEYMRSGHSITPKEARELFGSDRLGARIKDIERMIGYAPSRRYTTVTGVDPQGRPKQKRVMRYWLPDEG